MSEEFLHYLWGHRIFPAHGIKTADDEDLDIIHPGEHNTDAGPDFFNARISIDGTTWAGNIEIHINSSDWEKHGHNVEGDYANVILHVVFNHDKEIKRANGNLIPVFELPVQDSMYATYQRLMSNHLWIPCQNEITAIDPFVIEFWVNKLTVERLARKANNIKQVLERNKHNWEETFYQFMARAFGFRVNADPFERLARSVPLTVISKHKDNLMHVEAILFGQSGLIEPVIGADEYYQGLLTHYHHFKTKFNLNPLPGYIWKFARLRPSNFPTLRIAQFANLIHKSSALFSKILEVNSREQFMNLFNGEASNYWDTHYQFNRISAKKSIKRVGDSATENLLINAVAPFLFIYGKFTGNEDAGEQALSLLDKLSPENNTIIRHWKELGINAGSAYKTQGLLQLKNDYCTARKCLHCEIGNAILKKSNKN